MNLIQLLFVLVLIVALASSSLTGWTAGHTVLAFLVAAVLLGWIARAGAS